MQKRKKVSDLHKKWLAEPAYKAAYDELEHEFRFAEELIRARTRAKLTQEQVAAKMGTTQTAIARLESGREMPSSRTLQKYADATGHELSIMLRSRSALAVGAKKSRKGAGRQQQRSAAGS